MVAALAGRGIAAEALPMLEIVGVADPVARILAADGDAAALILTSPQAARLIGTDPRRPEIAGRTVYAVGQATAGAARDAGFPTVIDVGGDADALVALLARSDERRFVHAAGRDRTGDVAGRLGALGRTVAVAEIYRAEPVRRLPEAVVEGLAGGGILGLVAASARTASAFADLASSNCGLDPLAELVLFAISEAAAAPLAPHCRRTVIAALPNGKALVDCVAADAEVKENRQP
jgi:uroporphyrinogen-III synthase